MKKKLKIAFLLEMQGAVGGGGYAIYMFAEHLAKLGHEVRFYGLNKHDVFLKERDIPKNLKIYNRIYFNFKFKGAGRIDGLFSRLYSDITIANYIKKHKFDYIIGCLRDSAIEATRLGKRTNVKTVNFVYESPPWMENDLKERWFQDFKGKFKKSWEKTKKAYENSDILISNSIMSLKWCNQWLGVEKVKDYVYPGFELHAAKISKNRKNRAIYVGRLNKFKNIDVAINALSLVKNPPEFLIVGSGSEKENLEDLAKKKGVKCIFAGNVSDEDKWKMISESMFMVFPSSHEGFGMPPMEALACEVPCICSNKPIFKEVYENNVEYFKEGDIGDLKRKMESLIKNYSEAHKKAVLGRKYVFKKFDWNKSAKKIEKILLKK